MRKRDDVNTIFTKLKELLYENYEIEENILRHGSGFTFERVDLTIIQFHQIKLKRDSSYIQSLTWLLNKRVTINPQNYDDNGCFKYAMIAALHHQDINNHPERINNLTPFISNYNWLGIDFPVEQKGLDTFERNNKDVALNVYSIPYNKKEVNIRRSDYNCKREKSVDLLMITDNENSWHYLAIKNLSGLYQGISSNHHGDFICRSCGHAYCANNTLKDHERLCYEHDYCKIDMPKPSKNILKHNFGDKTKIPHAIYFDLETSQIPNETNQFTDLNESYTKEMFTHVACSYSIVLVRYDKSIARTYTGKDCIQKFCDDLYELGMKCVNAPKKKNE